ncbi:MAG: DoxX family protein, partial [Olleya sp.]
MKYIVGFLRIFVGIFFIISGFIKLNDPIGFAFKLEEYFG